MRLSPQATAIVEALKAHGSASDGQLALRTGIPVASVRRARREAEEKASVVLCSSTPDNGPLLWAARTQDANY